MPRVSIRARAPARLTMLAVVLLLAALLLAAGCNWGTRPQNFAPALGPAGASVTFRLREGRSTQTGELYAVDSSGAILLAPRLVHVAWSRFDWADVQKLGDEYDVAGRQPVGAEQRARLALVSRFPQGLSGDLLQRVLRMLSQPALEELR